MMNPFGGSKAEPEAASTAKSVSADTGVGCGTDPETGVRLCLGTTECEDVMLDLDDFPGCGFRTTKGSYDLECVCNGQALCPVGIASSCDEIAGLFAHRSLTEICNQVGDGDCAEVGKPAAPSAPRTSPTCDKVCAADCAGAPHCLKSCGC